MQIIKNDTPYIGKIKLKFEKFPYYSSSGDRLNKVHLDLGFTKLVSRIKVQQTFDGDSLRPEIVAEIIAKTGLSIADHKFGPLDNPEEYTLPNSCISPDGDYVGDINRGYWYLKNGLQAKTGAASCVAWQQSTKKWVGYSHRASCGFGKGDMLFDSKWVPTDEDMLKYDKYYTKHLDKYSNELYEWMSSDSQYKTEEFNMNIWAVDYIPFRLRGSKLIKSYEEAYEAALNFANYVG